MSGHSKWSKVKHQKASTDAVKGKIFTKMANAIIMAVKQGGGTDPDSNFKLRLAIDRAKNANMPKDNIVRAIERAGKSGESESVSEIIYEAFGPGAVSHLFQQVGLLEVEKNSRTFDEIFELVSQAGGIDMEEEEGIIMVYSTYADLHKVREFLEKHAFKILSAELYFRPDLQLNIEKTDLSEKIDKLLIILEDTEDIQRVYTNYKPNV
ncbi:MAG: transcriptional regulator [Candidatus Gottesmanbacteria bacterium GW2011_GWA2_42_18]|uniref:Transcriptional regulator n=1 Tax=Candidatus Gottesmanbacteria bacterium GW2011_GWA2_42_18 TaxID=1618442 RepID=A0A0G1BL96_9BACT|nr:MAG: transcriptional regulator [Candidatus Gottesmanbacteria bacterium GW2011_GWA2_42_18]